MHTINHLEQADYWLSDPNLHALVEQGFCIIENACPAALFEALMQESIQLQAEFQQAKIAQGGLNQAIRGDTTRWLQPEDSAGRRYLALLEKLGSNLNQQLYSGIRRVEAHYAAYAVGDFYKLHRDNPVSNDFHVANRSHATTLTQQQSRVISTVFYLNPVWQPGWHGELHLQDNQQQWHNILPMPNRLVIFQSNLLHEVCPATHERRSIAGWLRRDEPLF